MNFRTVFHRYWFALFALTLPLIATSALATVINYRLDNVALEEGNAAMTGVFSWTFTPGDFENGVGQFLSLDIPFTLHDETDLQATFDVGNSIEITFPGNVHDDGLDITLFLLQALTPTSGAIIDLVRSAYDIGGNGFHAGSFVSGSVQPSQVAGVGSGESVIGVSVPKLNTYPNPFNPSLTVTFVLEKDSHVRIGVFSLAGRRVRNLVADRFALAGRVTTVWDGRDAAGRAVASGPYFVRLDTDVGTSTRKVLLAK